MANVAKYGRAHFHQHHSQRSEAIKDKLASIYTSTVNGILSRPPFNYPAHIAKNVSEGIVNHGDKLMNNVTAESDDEEDTEELNQIGDDFQAMVDITLLKLYIDDGDHEEEDKLACKLYPMPQKGFHVSTTKVAQFAKALEEIRTFLKMRAFQGYVAAIVILGKSTEDGLVFGGQQTVPMEVIEGQVQRMIEGRGKQLAPMAVDLVVVEGDHLKVATVKANEDNVDYSTIQDSH